MYGGLKGAPPIQGMLSRSRLINMRTRRKERVDEICLILLIPFLREQFSNLEFGTIFTTLLGGWARVVWAFWRNSTTTLSGSLSCRGLVLRIFNIVSESQRDSITV